MKDWRLKGGGGGEGRTRGDEQSEDSVTVEGAEVGWMLMARGKVEVAVLGEGADPPPRCMSAVPLGGR